MYFTYTVRCPDKYFVSTKNLVEGECEACPSLPAKLAGNGNL